MSCVWKESPTYLEQPEVLLKLDLRLWQVRATRWHPNTRTRSKQCLSESSFRKAFQIRNWELINSVNLEMRTFYSRQQDSHHRLNCLSWKQSSFFFFHLIQSKWFDSIFLTVNQITKYGPFALGFRVFKFVTVARHCKKRRIYCEIPLENLK